MKNLKTITEKQTCAFNIFKSVIQNDPHVDQANKKTSVIKKLYGGLVHSEVATGQKFPLVVLRAFKKDKTRFLFSGKNYSKGRMALEVVKKYMQTQNPTLQQLKAVFADELTGNGKGFGLIREIGHITDKTRYFVDTPLKTSDNKKICVSSQFGISNIMPMVNKGISFGMQIEKVEKR